MFFSLGWKQIQSKEALVPWRETNHRGLSCVVKDYSALVLCAAITTLWSSAWLFHPFLVQPPAPQGRKAALQPWEGWESWAFLLCEQHLNLLAIISGLCPSAMAAVPWLPRTLWCASGFLFNSSPWAGTGAPWNIKALTLIWNWSQQPPSVDLKVKMCKDKCAIVYFVSLGYISIFAFVSFSSWQEELSYGIFHFVTNVIRTWVSKCSDKLNCSSESLKRVPFV